MDIFSLATQVKPYVVECRRHFHRHPELSDREENTIAFVKGELTKMGIEHVEVPYGGVLGFIEGPRPGKSVVLRADMDALPIQESPVNGGGFPKACVSEVPGVGHLCGHDAHTAVLLGSAKVLSEHREEIEGRVILFFQRGEEYGYGMDFMMRYLQDNKIHVDGAWGMHVNTGARVGQIGLCSGGFYSGALSFALTVTSPNEEPPVDCAVAIVNALNVLRMREVLPIKSVTLTVTGFQTVENKCKLIGTCRYHDQKVDGRNMHDAIERSARELCRAYGCTLTGTVGKPTIGVMNDPTCCEIARAAVGAAIGADHLYTPAPAMGHEDFSALAAFYPSMFAALGVTDPDRGLTAGIHNEHFEANEDAFPYGVAATVSYALGFLKHKEDIPFDGITTDYDTFLVEVEGRKPPKAPAGGDTNDPNV